MTWGLGITEPKRFAEAKGTQEALPSPHSSLYAQDRERALRTGVPLLTTSALELLGRP
ncbi:hypothetical protein [Corallococcus sp. AS-1-6]|uniref:hypothetical protein n=1 Tax=Corallococcus TaxID=83461 RepID=UPI001CC1359B|nr:hypothetical protein [Corallococcus sp. AS-1-6]MBZ4377492.1 hypothetical protein [Corallococcus sp. AS-1-6]